MMNGKIVKVKFLFELSFGDVSNNFNVFYDWIYFKDRKILDDFK